MLVGHPPAVVLSGGDRPLVEVIGSKGIALVLVVLLGVLDVRDMYLLVLTTNSPGVKLTYMAGWRKKKTLFTSIHLYNDIIDTQTYTYTSCTYLWHIHQVPNSLCKVYHHIGKVVQVVIVTNSLE